MNDDWDVLDEYLRQQGYGGSGNPTPSFDVPATQGGGRTQNAPTPQFDTAQPFGGHYVTADELAELNARGRGGMSDAIDVAPSVSPYSSIGSQTRMDELPPLVPTSSPPVPQTNLPLPGNAESASLPAPEVAPKDVPLLGALASMLSPEDASRAPIVGGLASAISNVTRPTSGPKLAESLGLSGDMWNQVIATVLFGKNTESDQATAAFGKQAAKEMGVDENAAIAAARVGAFGNKTLGVTGGTLNALLSPLFGLGNELRDVPLVGTLYRVGFEAPMNVLNEATTATGGALKVGGEILGRGVTDVAGMYGAKGGIAGLWEPGSRVQEYFGELQKNARTVAEGKAVQPQDYLSGAFAGADPTQQLFLTLVNPVNAIDILPIGELSKLRATARATGKTTFAEARAFGRTVVPRMEITGDAPLVARMLFDLPKTERAAEGAVKLRTAEQLGLKQPSWWNRVVPMELTQKAKGFEMLRRTLDNMDSRFADMNSTQFQDLLERMAYSSRKGELAKEFFDQYPNMVATDAQRAIRLTGEFDIDSAVKDVDAKMEWAKQAVDDPERDIKKMPKLWRDAVNAVRSNKGFDADTVFDQVRKVELRSKWGAHVASGIREGLGIKDPGMVQRMFDKLRSWEGALYIGLNPGSWVRNGVQNKTNMAFYGINPRSDFNKIESTYKALGWDPFKEANEIAREVIGKRDSNAGMYGASIPQKISDALPFFENIEKADRKRAYWSGFDKALRLNWRPGNWFKRMPVQLERDLREVHPRLPNLVYGAIERGRSMQQVLDSVNNIFKQVSVESFLDDPDFQIALAQNLDVLGLDADTTRAFMLDHLDGMNEAIDRAFARRDVPLAQALDEEFAKYRQELIEHLDGMPDDVAMRKAAQSGATQSDAEYQRILERARATEPSAPALGEMPPTLEEMTGEASVPRPWTLPEDLRTTEYATIADERLPQSAEELAYDETRRQLETKKKYDKDRSIRKVEKAHPEWKEAYEERWGSDELPPPRVEPPPEAQAAIDIASVEARNATEQAISSIAPSPAINQVEDVSRSVKVMGVDSNLAAQREINGVRYELYKGAGADEQRAALRVIDTDSGEIVTLKQYPTYAEAEKEYGATLARVENDTPQPIEASPIPEPVAEEISPKVDIAEEQAAPTQVTAEETITSTTKTLPERLQKWVDWARQKAAESPNENYTSILRKANGVGDPYFKDEVLQIDRGAAVRDLEAAGYKTFREVWDEHVEPYRKAEPTPVTPTQAAPTWSDTFLRPNLREPTPVTPTQAAPTANPFASLTDDQLVARKEYASQAEFAAFQEEINRRGLRQRYMAERAGTPEQQTARAGESQVAEEATVAARSAEDWFQSLRQSIADAGDNPVEWYAPTLRDWNARYHAAKGTPEKQVRFTQAAINKMTPERLQAYGRELAAKIRKEFPELADSLERDIQTKAGFVWNKITNGDYAKFGNDVEQRMFERVRDGDRIIRALTNDERGLDLTGLRGYTEAEVPSGRATTLEASVSEITPERPTDLSATTTAGQIELTPEDAGGLDSGIRGSAATDEGLPAEPSVANVNAGTPELADTGTTAAVESTPIEPTTGAGLEQSPTTEPSVVRFFDVADQYTKESKKILAVGDKVLLRDGYVYEIVKFSSPNVIGLKTDDGTMFVGRGDIRNKLIPSQTEAIPNVTSESTTQGLGPSPTTSGASMAGERPPDSINDVGTIAQENVAPVSGTNVESLQPTTGTENATSGSVGTGNKRVRSIPATADGDPVAGVARSDHSDAGGRDYVITESDQIGHGGAKTKFKQNVRAIELVNELDAAKRFATPEEQAELVKYVGWGGLSDKGFFNPREEATIRGMLEDSGREYTENYLRRYDAEWGKEKLQLLEVLNPEDYAQARASTLNAHYTSPEVIKAMWQAVRRFGWEGGRTLEPAVGVGHFFGMMPTDMAARSARVGVDKDALSARISKQLYQRSNIMHAGYEEVKFPDDYFSLGISNVPFGNIQITDPRYNNQRFILQAIHDYYFAKTLDKTEPGGIVAFITSHFTMDKQDARLRNYVADRADLLGMIRLPNSAFKGNAGTEVTTDIIFLQKRLPGAPMGGESFRNLGEVNGFPINEYFERHPEMLLGEWSNKGSMYGKGEMTLLPLKNADLAAQLQEAIQGLPENIYSRDAVARIELATAEQFDTAMRDARTGRTKQMRVEQGKAVLVGNGGREVLDVPAKELERIKAFDDLRNQWRETMETWRNPETTDVEANAALKKLNAVYDKFSDKYGYVNSRKNASFFRRDDDFPNIRALEAKVEGTPNEWEKMDALKQRTIFPPEKRVYKIETAKDALVTVLNEHGRVDLKRMAELANKEVDTLKEELRGVIFRNPDGDWETADAYLSGNVREKLRAAESAAQIDEAFAENAEALRQVLPQDLTPDKIEVDLGAPWMGAETIRQFMAEISGHSPRSFRVEFQEPIALWKLDTPGYFKNYENQADWNTQRYSFYNAVDDAANHRSPTIFDSYRDANGDTVRTINTEQTTAARALLDKVKKEFSVWAWKDETRTQELVRVYNDKFNAFVEQKYDGSHLTFPGMSTVWRERMYPHQKNGIWRALSSQGNTLLSHSVGSGKSLQLASVVMEAKRLGIAKKSVLLTEKNLVSQLGGQIRDIYPGARVLMATEKDFDAANRRAFMARIANGDWDAIVMSHSQFNMLPVSPETFTNFVQDEINRAVRFVEMAKAEMGKKDPSIKEIEKHIENLRTRIDKYAKDYKKDTNITFEELGVDQVVVDESHNFKRLWFQTKMGRVRGVQPDGSERAFNLYIKLRHLNERNNGRGIVFATGTPLSNTLAEIYTLQRFLAPQQLEELGIDHFDAWAHTFGKLGQFVEPTPDGTRLKVITAFRQFQNVRQLSSLFRQFADVQLTKDLIEQGVLKNMPKLENGSHIIVKTQPTAEFKSFQARLLEMMKQFEARPTRETRHIPLWVLTKGNLASVDMRLIDNMFENNPSSKLNVAARQVFDVWKETHAAGKTQLVFINVGVPGGSTPFNTYAHLRNSLIEMGIPANEVEFRMLAKSPSQKVLDEMMAQAERVKSGKTKVLIGSYPSMGQGLNVQENLFAVHHIDVPWRPDQIEQADGRIIRQGNKNPNVRVYRYVTERSTDMNRWTKIEQKSRMVEQFLKGDLDANTMEDVGAISSESAAEIAAAASGNPLMVERALISSEAQNLELQARAHQTRVRGANFELATLPQNIAARQKDLDYLHGASKAVTPATKPNEFKILVGGTEFTEKEAAGAEVLRLARAFADSGSDLPTLRKGHSIGTYRGIDMSVSVNTDNGKTYPVVRFMWDDQELAVADASGESATGMITRLNNALDGLGKRADMATEQIGFAKNQLNALQKIVTTPFEYQKRLDDIRARLAEIDKELNPDDKLSKAMDSLSDEGGDDLAPADAGFEGITADVEELDDARVETAARTTQDTETLAETIPFTHKEHTLSNKLKLPETKEVDGRIYRKDVGNKRWVLEGGTKTSDSGGLPPESASGMTLDAGEPRFADDLARLNYESAQGFRKKYFQSDDMPAAMGPNAKDAAKANVEAFDAMNPLVKQFVLNYAVGMKPMQLDRLTAQAVSDYLQSEVKPALGDAFQAANAVGRWNVGRTVLDYDARTNFDQWLSYVFPFAYWRRAQAWNWAQRFLEKPNLLIAYAKAQQQLDDMTNSDEYPERLRGKLRLPLPFKEKWMGNDIFFDPLDLLIPLKNVYGAELQRAQYSNIGNALLGLPASNEDITKLLRRKAARGEIDRRAAENAIASRSGDLWEGAKQEARQDVGGPDNLTGLFTPHAPLQWLIAALTNQSDAIGPLLPQSRPIRQITGALGVNGGEGINIESPVRNILRAVGLTDLPEFDPWENYRVRRMLANMVADGSTLNGKTITEKEARRAMLEKRGALWQEAARRANAERMPWTSILTPTSIYPEGERDLSNARAQLRTIRTSEVMRLGGNPNAMTYSEQEDLLKRKGAYAQDSVLSLFYKNHPELDARSAMFQSPEEMLKKWMIDELWEKYNDLSAIDKRAVRAQLGDTFNDYFVNKETRAYDKIDLLDLVQWGMRFDAEIPNVPRGEIETLDLARLNGAEKLQFAPPAVAQVYQSFTTQMKTQFDESAMWSKADEYKQLSTKQEKQDFLKRNTDFDAWRTAWGLFYDQNPEVKAYLTGVGALEAQPSAATGAGAGTKEQQFYQAIVAAGLDWDAMKAKQKEYSALPKGTGARSRFLKENGDYKRYYDLRNAFFGDSETYGEPFYPNTRGAAQSSSGRAPSRRATTAKVYDPNDYLKEPRAPRGNARSFTRTPHFGSSEMFAVLARARKKYYERYASQQQGGAPAADSQYRLSPRI